MPVLKLRDMTLNLSHGQASVFLEHKGDTQDEWTGVNVFMRMKVDPEMTVKQQKSIVIVSAIETLKAGILMLQSLQEDA